ncbi:WD repeat-containing protein 41-like [Dendronephthya gigantea]|uniref:WD repeat-containing protein 41-like n=1 Tax=Dendronephthya gigantea TaxID=151771 RepID=UPI00106BEE1E|nr:WD repeat-containing protein 41-like [Dendronephthya gigantea]
MLSKLWPGSNRTPVNKLPPRQVEEVRVPAVEDDQPHNPFKEIRVLTGHQDIINIIKVIDETRLASSADDNLVNIWDFENGDKLHALHGHTRPVTSMLVYQKTGFEHQDSFPVLITASSDKTIRIWDCGDGVCLNIIQDHASTVKCLVNVHDFAFCSGGKDLCLWDIEGQLLCKEVQPDNDSDVHSILPLKKDKLVIAFSRPSLVVYSISNVLRNRSFKFHSRLRPHRDDVRCLTGLTEESFVSASLDGEIIVWSSNSLQPIKQFNEIREFEGTTHLYPYSVQHLFVLDQRFIIAAVGAGFAIYDALSGKCVAQRENAHHSKVSYVQLLSDSFMLATCSEDGTVRLWKSLTRRLPEEFSPIEHFLGKSLNDITSAVTEPVLLGECLGHSGSVRMIADFGADGFASCASDGIIILWKDGWRERQKRLELATSLLFN